MATEVTGNYDSNVYLEGLTYGEAIMLGVTQTSWLIEDVNYIKHSGTKVGTVIINTLSANGKKAARTALCDTGTSNTPTAGQVPVSVDGKFSHMFNGCFAATGIADMNQLKVRNDVGMQFIKDGRDDDMYKTLADGATLSEIDSAEAIYEADPIKYLTALSTEFFTKFGRFPTSAVVTGTFFGELLDKIQNRQTMMGDNAITGERRMTAFISGMTVVPYNGATEKAIVSVPRALHEYVPGNMTQIPELADVVSIPNLANVSYANGFLTKHDVNASSVAINTWVHYINGRVAIPEQALKSLTVVAP